MERIDKIIAAQTEYSRKDVKKMISQKKIEVDGKIIKSADEKIKENAVIKINGKEFSGKDVYYKLGLRSSDFEIEQVGSNVTFQTKGYGHGVGMSQTGADSMAKQGSNYEEIIKHYYIGVEITNL